MCLRQKILIFEGKTYAFASLAREHMFLSETLRFGTSPLTASLSREARGSPALSKFIHSRFVAADGFCSLWVELCVVGKNLLQALVARVPASAPVSCVFCEFVCNSALSPLSHPIAWSGGGPSRAPSLAVGLYRPSGGRARGNIPLPFGWGPKTPSPHAPACASIGALWCGK